MATMPKCATCARFPGLLCGPCAAKRDALAASVGLATSTPPSKTDMQVCALRELVLAHHAVKRAHREFCKSIAVCDMSDEDTCTIDSYMNEWLDYSAPSDARDVNADTLHAIFCHIPTDGVHIDDTDADPEDQEIEGDTDGHERCTSCDDALAQSQIGLCDDCQNAEDDENEEWSAGWNMPGYMPDNPPEIFATQDDAKRYIIDELKRSEDDAENEDDAETLCHFAEECNLQSGEFGATCGKYHYFVSKV